MQTEAERLVDVVNIFLVEVKSPYSLDLMNEISNLGFKVSHITSSDAPPALNNYNVIDSKKLYRSETLSKFYGDYFKPLTKEILEAFQDVERDFYILTDRANSRPISFRKRKLLFNDLIRFWLGYLEKEQIDCIYFPYTPHGIWDLVLMRTAQYLNVPYCYLSHTAINNRSILRTTYKSIKQVPADFLSGLSVEELKEKIEPVLLKDFEDESVVTSVVKLQNDFFQKQVGTNADENEYKSFYEKEKTRYNFKRTMRIAKESIRSALETLGVFNSGFRFATSLDDRKPLWGWELSMLKHRKFADNLKKAYTNLAIVPDMSEKYIYFPLHLQPELTSQPEGGYFEDQYLALETILAALPDGWKVYVKENPRQFDISINAVSAMHFRNQDDFDQLLQHPSVSLVSQSVKSEELIQSAQVTATITGTAGWEALNLGKPCVTFGKPWYSPCQSCFVVETPEEMSAALNEAQGMDKEDVYKNILRYLSFYQHELVISTLHAPSDVSYNTLPANEMVKHHSQAIVDFFKSKKKSADVVDLKSV